MDGKSSALPPTTHQTTAAGVSSSSLQNPAGSNTLWFIIKMCHESIAGCDFAAWHRLAVFPMSHTTILGFGCLFLSLLLSAWARHARAVVPSIMSYEQTISGLVPAQQLASILLKIHWFACWNGDACQVFPVIISLRPGISSHTGIKMSEEADLPHQTINYLESALHLVSTAMDFGTYHVYKDALLHQGLNWSQTLISSVLFFSAGRNFLK